MERSWYVLFPLKSDTLCFVDVALQKVRDRAEPTILRCNNDGQHWHDFHEKNVTRKISWVHHPTNKAWNLPPFLLLHTYLLLSTYIYHYSFIDSFQWPWIFSPKLTCNDSAFLFVCYTIYYRKYVKYLGKYVYIFCTTY